MDLSRDFPRSPKQKIAGLVQLGRMIDKGRAYKEKKLAEYIYPCPLDKIILNFLCIDADAFAKMVANKRMMKLVSGQKSLQSLSHHLKLVLSISKSWIENPTHKIA